MEVKIKVPVESDVDWKSFLEKAVELKKFEIELERSKKLQRSVIEMLASKSKLTEKDALELGRKVSKGLAKRYK